MPEIVDSHAHLVMDEFASDIDEVLKRAEKAGVKWVLVPATDVKSAEKVVQLCEKFPNVYGAAGIHPHDAEKATEQDIEAIASLLQHPRIVAVGEIGMDFYYSFSAKAVQERIFSVQLALAKINNLPVVIHSREAVEDILAIYDAVESENIRGVFHCFTGSVQELEKIIDRGFYVSVGGMVTFKNFRSIDMVKKIPLDRLLVETDAPYLTPVPYRGKRNEPSYTIHIISRLAQLFNMSVEEIAEITTLNAEKLFLTGTKG